MSEETILRASECIEDLRLSISAAEFGYRVQAIAAHVLLRLNCRVTEINQWGHPDIVAIRGAEELRFEIEAEVSGPRPRQLTDEDFASLLDSSWAVGYFALAIAFPTPRWIVVPAEHLKDRRPSSNILLEALSDRDFSNAWTSEYLKMLNDQCRRLQRASFAALRERALLGRGLQI